MKHDGSGSARGGPKARQDSIRGPGHVQVRELRTGGERKPSADVMHRLRTA